MRDAIDVALPELERQQFTAPARAPRRILIN
jgi:hypothetical protein